MASTSDSDSAFTIPLPNGMRFYGVYPGQRVSAEFLIREIFVRHYYDRPEFRCSKNDRVIDIGANMGLFALWMSPQVADGQIICVEPSSAIETLRLNLLRNEVKNVTPVQCAVGSADGIFELLEYPEFNGVNHRADFTPAPWGQFFIRLLLRRRPLPPNRIVCDCRTLESILEESRFDRVQLLKIDCEGGEYDILNGSSNEVLNSFDRICMEFHEIHKDHDYRILVRRLEGAGFSVNVVRPWFDRLFLRTGAIWAIRNKQ